VYQGVLRSMSVTVIPMWLIVAISGMVESGGRDRDAESVGDGNADQSAEIGVGRRNLGVDLGEKRRGAGR
jgi:hypothetical protein